MTRTLVAISESTAREAIQWIAGCEYCSERAESPLPCVLDELTGSNGHTTDYVLPHSLRCPDCAEPITENTFIVRRVISLHRPISD